MLESIANINRRIIKATSNDNDGKIDIAKRTLKDGITSWNKDIAALFGEFSFHNNEYADDKEIDNHWN